MTEGDDGCGPPHTPATHWVLDCRLASPDDTVVLSNSPTSLRLVPGTAGVRFVLFDWPFNGHGINRSGSKLEERYAYRMGSLA